MRVSVHVKLHAKNERVEETGSGEYAVFVHAKPLEGQANEAVTRLLARHFGVGTSQVRIVSGATARRKTVEIS